MHIRTIGRLSIGLTFLLSACGQAGNNNASNTAAQKGESGQTGTARQPQYTHTGTTYHALVMKDSGRKVFKSWSDNQKRIIYALNRIDSAHAPQADTLIVPDDFKTDIMAYSPYPYSLPFLKDVHKIIFFSYPNQVFAAYENGNLMRWGPTNMGRKKDRTPTGLFYTNWKAEQIRSTSNDEWILKWNFNIINDSGVGFHEYSLPGYPASHSCLRLLREDAQYLYSWADEWVQINKEKLACKGTPVIVFGAYPFGQRRPWRNMLQDPKVMDITASTLQQLVDQDKGDIMAQQNRRDSVESHKSALKTAGR